MIEPNLIAVIIAAMAPISELRGAIPLGVGLGLDPVLVIITSILFNILVFFPIYFGFTLLYKRIFSKWDFVNRSLERSHKRCKPYIDKYGIMGLTVFIGIPLPITGVWTGTTAAWLMRLDWKKSLAAACVGVIISATIVSLLTLGLVNGFGHFLT